MYWMNVAVLFVVLAPLGYLVQHALSISPVTGQEVYGTLALNFSLPPWTYFALAAALVSVRRSANGCSHYVPKRKAAGVSEQATHSGEEAVKPLPWEIAHISAFLFAPAPGEFAVLNGAGLGASYALFFTYLLVALRTGGRRSIHAGAFMTSQHRRMSGR